MRGNGVHQHGRRIRGLAARDVDADPVQRRDLLPQHRAIGLGVGEAAQFLALAFVEGADALGGDLQRLALGRRQAVQGRLQFGLRNIEGRHFRSTAMRDAVKTVGVFQHGGIAARLHIGQDFCDRRFNRRIGTLLERQQRVERLLETFLA